MQFSTLFLVSIGSALTVSAAPAETHKRACTTSWSAARGKWVLERTPPQESQASTSTSRPSQLTPSALAPSWCLSPKAKALTSQEMCGLMFTSV
ncbi:hypothetical protein V8F06_009911 [Rhypophila decipiens]